MQKKITRLEKKVEDRIHAYDCPPEASLGEVFNVLCDFQKYVIEKMEELRPKPKQEEEKCQEES